MRVPLKKGERACREREERAEGRRGESTGKYRTGRQARKLNWDF